MAEGCTFSAANTFIFLDIADPSGFHDDGLCGTGGDTGPAADTFVSINECFERLNMNCGHFRPPYIANRRRGVTGLCACR